tara:strand:+ start:353 stop:550 length:198 start_codon:yes stop_codon:yes gene_type:complete
MARETNSDIDDDDAWQEDVMSSLNEAISGGDEGLILKKLNSTYVPDERKGMCLIIRRNREKQRST